MWPDVEISDGPAKVAHEPSLSCDVTSLPADPLNLLLLGRELHLDWDRSWILLHISFQLLGSLILSSPLLLKFSFLACHCPLSDKMNFARCCHPFRLPLPGPVLFVHLFVSPWVKDPSGDLHFRLCAHLIFFLFHRGGFCRL